MNKKQITITSLGNTLEWFDFGLVLFLAPIIGAQFFPSEHASTQTLAALLVFAAGFVCRPLGGILFGHSGDTQGRAKTLRISIMIISISTLLVGLLPNYHTLGIFSPILFVSLRLMHGISIGGEYSGVMIYLAESAPFNKRGFITSFAAIGANVGFLSATLVLLIMKYFFTEQMIADWAWRLPFIFMGLLGSGILYFRFKLKETATFSYLQETKHLKSFPLMTALQYAPRSLLKIIGVTAMSSTLYYIFFGYLPIYLEKYVSIKAEIGLTLQSVCLVLMLFLVPLSGYIGDLFGRKKVMIMTSFLVILFMLPSFYLLHTRELFFLIIVYLLATILSSLDQGNSLAAVVENCPADVRYTGVSVAYNIGMALFGGTAPLILALLTEKIGPIAPAYYLMVMAGISLIAAMTLLKKAAIKDMIGQVHLTPKKINNSIVVEQPSS